MLTVRPAIIDDAHAMTRLVHSAEAYAGIYRQVILTQVITDDYIRRNPARVPRMTATSSASTHSSCPAAAPRGKPNSTTCSSPTTSRAEVWAEH